MKTRRQLLAALIAGALAAPARSFAQQPSAKRPRLGWLGPGTPASQADALQQFWNGMRDFGYVEGHTIEAEYLYAEARLDGLPGLAAKLVEHKVGIIVTASTPGFLAAKPATATIPTGFSTSSEPISTGIVASLARPGGNITG